MLPLPSSPHRKDRMNTDALAAQLEIDEDRTLQVYIDTRGHWTTGVGHKLINGEMLISDVMCDALLELDMGTAIRAAYQLIPDLDTHHEEVQQIVANMAFNLGYAGLSKFKATLAAIKARDYHKAADQMVKSLWYRQTKSRAVRLVARMRAVANITQGVRPRTTRKKHIRVVSAA